MTGDFDRIKSPERRIAERAGGSRLDDPAADGQGRAALFSGVTEASGGVRSGTARIPRALHCSRCDATSALDVATAVRAALPLFLVAPWRDHPLFAGCPACRHRAWLALRA